MSYINRGETLYPSMFVSLWLTYKEPQCAGSCMIIQKNMSSVHIVDFMEAQLAYISGISVSLNWIVKQYTITSYVSIR